MTDKTDSKEREAFVEWMIADVLRSATKPVSDGMRDALRQTASQVWDSGEELVVRGWKARASLAASELPKGITRDDTVHGETYFTAADMATAAAQGFRDGVASIAASAGSEPVAYAMFADNGNIRLWSKARIPHPDAKPLYLHPSPPEGMVGGWQDIATAPKDGTYLLLWEQYSTNPFVGCWAFGSWSVSHEHVDAEGGWDGAIVVDSISQDLITHWMHLPPPPISFADSRKGE